MMNDLKDFDSFWLEKGQALVNETFTNLNRHLKNYNTYLTFLLGFYTAIGLTTAILFDSINPFLYAGFLIPIIVTYIAFWKISVGQSVPLKSLDLRSPLKINDAHNNLVEGLKKDIKKAKLLVSVATFSVLIGGSITAYYLNLEEKNTEKLNYIERIEKLKNDFENFKEAEKIKIKNEFNKDFRGKQKFSVTIDDNKITVNAKLIKGGKYTIKYIDAVGNEKLEKIDIPKYVEYTRDINNAKRIIEIK